MASMVIGIRLTHLAMGGPVALVEAERMVSEKMWAFGEAATLLALGVTPHAVVKGYRRHVQANVQRLAH